MKIKQEVLRTERQIEGLRAGSSSCQMVSLAGSVRVQRTILPPLEVYEAWLDEQRIIPSGGHVWSMNAMDAKKLRRMAVMKHGGETQRAIAAAVGLSQGSVWSWLSRLPIALGGKGLA